MLDTDSSQFTKPVQRFIQEGLESFLSISCILEIAQNIFELRHFCQSNQNDKSPDVSHRAALLLERKATCLFHQRLKASSRKIPLIDLFKIFGLNQMEKEITALMILSHLGLIPEIRKIEGIQRYMDNRNISKAIAIGKALNPDSRLLKSRIILNDNGDKYFRFSKKFMGAIAVDKKGLYLGWQVKSYAELLDHLYPLVKELKSRAETAGDSRENENVTKIIEHTITIDNLLWELNYTLRRHPSWKLNELTQSKLQESQKLILFVLIGKELNFFPPQDSLFTGAGLAQAVCASPSNCRERLNLLKQNNRLCRENFIQVCGGASDSRVTEDTEALQSCQFELTSEFMKKLKIKRFRKPSDIARKPTVAFGQLVFSEKIKSSIELCLAQIQNQSTLFNTWQLGKTIGYGTGVTILFSGPPGTGKTACAEAIAHRLDKTIITVNYSQIQNCWVGQTEKNIVRVFGDASQADAVLFWDEADAMFYNRDSASKNWEVRDVNVLLQELERFKGVCILSTNRKTSLDKALERRISLKIEFERPSKEVRRQIWKNLLPPKMPIDKSVSLDELSQVDLSGGEIKNVILNAARIALKNNPNQPGVCRQDFMEAIKLEQQGSWSGAHSCFGFQTSKAGTF